MAYVNFWKGPAADYVAETHGEGIYQCTDTGDTYIFGVKNSGSGGGGESNSYHILDWAEDLAGGKGTISDNAYNLLNNFITSKDINTPVFIKAISTTNTQATPDPAEGLDINLIPAEIYISGTMIYLSLFTKLYIPSEFPSEILISDIDVISKVNFQISMDSKSIELSMGNLEFELVGDGTKFLSDDGSYKTPTMDLATPSSNGLMSSTDKAKLDSLKATTINATEAGFTSPIPLDQYSVYSVMVHSNVTLSFSGSLEKGQEFFLILRNPEATAYTVTFPSSSTFVSLSGDSMELPGHGYIEISILRDANGDYLIRAAASLE